MKVRRYVLGLALTALTAPTTSYLRQGCNLVRDAERPRELTLVHPDGRREACALTHDEACAYATATAADFGPRVDRDVPFQKVRAEEELAEEKSGGKGKGASKTTKKAR